MSKLYASISSDAARTEATRRGHKRISTHTRGWTLGVRVVANVHSSGALVFSLYTTSGSNGGGADELIGYVVQTKTGPEWRTYVNEDAIA